MTPEVRVKTAIKKWLKYQGAWFFMPIGGAFTSHGVPDLIVCWRGRLVGIECKAPGKRGNTTPNQDMQIAGINGSGGFAFVADCLEDVVRVLGSLANKSVRETT